MKSIFGLLRQAQLGLISLLPIVAACIRNAPRNEPTPLAGKPNNQEAVSNHIITPGIKETSKNIAKHSTACTSKDIFLKEIGWSKDLTINDFQDLFNRLIPNGLPNRLFFFFENSRKDGSWYKIESFEPRSIIDSMISRSNPTLPNSEKHEYALVGFVIDTSEKLDISQKNDSKETLIACIKKDKEWCYYNNNYTHKTNFPTPEEAIRLASKRGIIFFYRKKEKTN